jgi:hypothetical protein
MTNSAPPWTPSQALLPERHRYSRALILAHEMDGLSPYVRHDQLAVAVTMYRVAEAKKGWMPRWVSHWLAASCVRY